MAPYVVNAFVCTAPVAGGRGPSLLTAHHNIAQKVTIVVTTCLRLLLLPLRHALQLRLDADDACLDIAQIRRLGGRWALLHKTPEDSSCESRVVAGRHEQTHALDLWFEDQPDVVPMSLDAMRRRADVAAAMAAGAVLLPVPYIPADTAVERVNITMERGLLRAIDETARGRGMTRSAFLSSAARRELVGG